MKTSSQKIVMCVSVLYAVSAILAAGVDDMSVSGPIAMVSAMPGSPILAEQSEERTSVTSEGKSISETVTSKVYRDRAGRLRLEWQVLDSNHRLSSRVAYVLDVVAGSSYMLLIDTKTGLHMGDAAEAGSFPVGLAGIGHPLPERKWQEKRQQLGKRDIQGIEAEGTQVSRTVQDDPSLTTTEETWYSRRLGVILAMKASGPGWTHAAELRRIEEREPEATLFSVPPDYTIQ